MPTVIRLVVKHKPQTSEWTMTHTINGVTDHNKTYYTEDEEDANQTMVAEALRYCRIGFRYARIDKHIRIMEK